MSDVNGLYGALAKAQAALTAPSKNREVSVKMQNGGTYKFKYATLDHLIEHIRKPLTDNGLWFVQFTEPGAMVTRITHEGGAHIDCAVPMPNLPNKPQEAGSVLSYFRRYSLSVALSLASDDDDDGNIAEGNGYEPRERKERQQKQEESRLSKAQWAKIVDLIKHTESDAAKVMKTYGVTDLKQISAADAEECIKRLESILADMARQESNKSLADELDDDSIPY